MAYFSVQIHSPGPSYISLHIPSSGYILSLSHLLPSLCPSLISPHALLSSSLLPYFPIIPLHSFFWKMKCNYFSLLSPLSITSPLSLMYNFILCFASLTGDSLNEPLDQRSRVEVTRPRPREKCPTTRGNGGDEGLGDNPGYVQIPPVVSNLFSSYVQGRLLLGL